MKKIGVLLVLFISNFCHSQAYPNSYLDHEVKLNIGLFLITTTIEGSYEYFLNEDTSIGGTIYADSDATDYNGNFGIGPNLRAYFGYEPRSGFFAEAFGLYRTGKEESESAVNSVALDYKTFALGIGGGTKLTSRSQKFTVEANIGLGRNFKTEDFQDTFMYRAGISVGFRF